MSHDLGLVKNFRVVDRVACAFCSLTLGFGNYYKSWDWLSSYGTFELVPHHVRVQSTIPLFGLNSWVTGTSLSTACPWLLKESQI